LVSYFQVSANGGYGGLASSGTVGVVEVDENHISATFDVTFNLGGVFGEEQLPDDRLTGSFNASFCSSWSRNASVP
jgi:hypothetical protein